MFQTNVFEDYETLSRRAADWLCERLQKRPAALLCLAAGSTPLRTYELLAERGTKEPSLFARCRLLKLDEWGGLAMDDPATCEHQLRPAIVDAAGRRLPDIPRSTANRKILRPSVRESPAGSIKMGQLMFVF